MKKGMSIKGIIILVVCSMVVLILEWFGIFFISKLIIDKSEEKIESSIENIGDIASDIEEKYKEDNKTTINEADYVDYKVYENKELGIRFRYPKEFDQTKEEESDGYKTILFYDKTTGSGVNLVTGNTTGIFNFNSYVTASLNSLKQSYSLTDEDIEVEKSDIYMGGKQAFKNYYVYSGVSIYQCATLKGKTEYVLTSSGREENFDKSIGDKVFASFEFIDESSNNSSDSSTETGTSKENSANVDEWCVASKYNPNNKNYQDVKVKVTKITRGDEAKSIVKDYADTDEYFDYEDPEAGQEWVVIDYDVDLTGFDIPSYGTSPSLTVSIVGTEKYNSIKYNGKTYITKTDKVSSDKYVTDTKVSNKVATTLPIGCTNYIVQFGVYNQTLAYVKGK